MRRLRSVVWPRGTDLHRGVRKKYAPSDLVPGMGNTRFAPLRDTQHVYVSRTATAALLESALHHASGPDPTIYQVELARWNLASVQLANDVRLVDLRDSELDRLEVDRTALVNTEALHYGCTRRWAEALQHRKIGGHQVDGIVWHSRQADLHALAHQGGLLGDLLKHRSIEVAVLWHPHAPKRPFVRRAVRTIPLVYPDGTLDQLVYELSALIRAPIE